MRHLAAASLGLAVTLCGATATASDAEVDRTVRHGLALALFEQACLAKAPDFRAAPQVFRAMGLTRPEDKTAYRNNEIGIYGGVVPMNAGGILGRQCSVLVKDGILPILVVGLRDTLGELAEPASLLETPPTRAQDPVLWDFRMTRIGPVSVTAGLDESGIAVMGMQVADRSVGVTQ
ncbi:MAG: hypothetical protein AAGC79_05215 [Pseudomonadota bacterium]